MWVDAGESVPRDSMGTLKYCLVGSWKEQSESPPFAREVEKWAKVAKVAKVA